MRAWLGTLGAMAVLAAGAALIAQDYADAQAPAPAPAAATSNAYEALQGKFERAVRGWRSSRTRVNALRAQLAKDHRLAYLVRHPSQANNRELAKLLFPDGFWALDKIAAGGDGIGGAPGESDWRETVWNGGGTDPAGPGPTAQSCGGGGIAYGIGQACPRTKMADWAGTEAVYRIPSLQIYWMNAYAEGRYGSLEAAGEHWNIQGVLVIGLAITGSACVAGYLIGMWDPFIGGGVVIMGAIIGLRITWTELS